MQRKLPKNSTTSAIHSHLASTSQNTSSSSAWSYGKKIAIAACGLGLAAAYYLTRKSLAEVSPYTVTCINPSFSVNSTDLAFNIVDSFRNQAELFNMMGEPTSPALFNGTMQHLKEALTKQLPCLVSAAVYKWLEKPIHFSFAPKKALEAIGLRMEAAQVMLRQKAGRFGNYILFQATPNLSKARNLAFITQNELFHFICVQANSKKIVTDSSLLPLPFLNEFGLIDLELREQYFETVNHFKKQLNKLDVIVNKHSKLTQTDKDKLAEANDVLRDYQPIISMQSFDSRSAFDQWAVTLNKKFFVGQIIPKANATGKLAKDIAAVIEGVEENSDGTISVLFSNHGHSKAEIFVADYKKLIRDKSELASYQQLDENHRMKEVGSDIDSLPSQAKNYFGKRFCEYMAKYIGLNKGEYCTQTAPKIRP